MKSVLLTVPFIIGFWIHWLFAQSSVQFHITPIRNIDCSQFCVVDIDGDGNDEVVYDLGVQVDVRDVTGENYLASFNKTGFSYLPMSPFCTGTLDSLAFLVRRDQDHFIYMDFWHPNSPSFREKRIPALLQFPAIDRDEDGEINLTIHPICAHAVYPGIQDMVLLKMDSGKDLLPRGIVAFRLSKREKVWEYRFGPQIIQAQVVDINHDLRPEILVSTYSPDNGAEWNGFADNASYIFLLDAMNGKLLWSRKMGGVFTGACALVGDLNGDGWKDIIAWRFSIGVVEGGQDYVAILDVRDGHILNQRRFGKKIPKTYRLDILKDIDGDGKDELVLGNSDGTIRIFNEDLNVERFSEVFPTEINPIQVGDVDGNGTPEILATSADHRLIILDHLLQQSGSIPLPLIGGFRLARHKNKLWLLIQQPVNVGSEKRNVVTIYRIQRAFFPPGTQPLVKWGVFLLVLVGMVVVARNLYIRYSIQNFITFLLRSGGFNENIIVINHRGKVLEIGKNVAKMFRIRGGAYRGKQVEEVAELSQYPPVLKAIQALRKQRSTGQSISVPVTIEQKEVLLEISSFYLPILKQYYIQIINRSDQEFARRVKSWAPVAQRMAHGIKNPLTSVKLNAEELKDILRERLGEQSRELDEYLESIISQAEKLSRISDRFMRFVRLETPRLSPVHLNQRIPELIAQWKPDSSRIKIEYQFQENLPRALLDAEQFEFVLKTVFFNAVESISDKGRILIATREVNTFSERNQEISQRFVEIEITDTGCGIPAALLAKVGEPYFTTKSRGTGLGLSIVKKIMEEHGGAFEIHSQENVGTTVLLRFRPAHR